MSPPRPIILVVEDNPTTLKLFRITLEQAGYQVIEAPNAQTALKAMESQAPTLVLQDLMLPDMDGASLTRRLRELAGRRNVPIIVVSGFGSLRLQLDDIQADASLLKPVTPSRLLEVVSSCLPLDSALTKIGLGRLILVVDDDPIQLKLARLRLGFAGFEVISASDGSAALEMARKRTPALILSDVLMPNLDGFELCLAVRREPQLAQVPVVLVSAHYKDQHDEELARKVGANALVVRTQDFQQVVDAILSSLAEPPPARPSEQTDELREEHHVRIIQQLKRQANVNAELLNRSVLQAAQISILGGVADALTRTADIEATIGDVLSACLDAGGISKGALFRIEGGRVLVTHSVGFLPTEQSALERLLTDGPMESLLDGQTVTFSLHSAALDLAERLRRSGLSWALTVPIMALGDGGCTGALLLGSHLEVVRERVREDVIDQELIAFGRAIGAYLGQATALADAFTRVSVAAEASRILTASLNLDETMLSLAKLMTLRIADLCEIAIRERTGALRTIFALRDDTAKEVTVRSLYRQYPESTAIDPARTALDGGPAQIVVETDDGWVAAVVRAPEQRRLLTSLSLRSRLIVPLVLHGQVIGSFSLGRFGSGRRLGMAELALAKDLANRLGVAVENARLHQQAEESARAKDEFLATVSHELRTPLSAILGWAVLLRTMPANAEKLERGLAVIERNGRAQAKLIEDILDVSRIVSGKLLLNTRMMEIAPVVRAAVDVVFPVASKKEIAIEVSCDPAAGMLLGDPERLQQVLWNLLSNSVKFSPKGARIDITVERHPSQVIIRVADTGKGIHPEFLPFVFDRFRQADNSTTRTEGGLGLGLALVKHLMTLHGGSVRLESPGAGLGTVVTLELPAADLAGEAMATPHRGDSAPAEVSLRLQGVRVLVLDDEEDARELMSILLRAHGALVCAASTVTEAMEAVERFRPTVIVSDIGMPGEDGFSFMRRVRALCNIPALALTAYTSVDDQIRTRQVGFQLHLCKPIDPKQFLDAVAQLAGQ